MYSFWYTAPPTRVRLALGLFQLGRCGICIIEDKHSNLTLSSVLVHKTISVQIPSSDSYFGNIINRTNYVVVPNKSKVQLAYSLL